MDHQARLRETDARPTKPVNPTASVSAHLCRAIYPARTAAYGFAGLILFQLEGGGWMLMAGIVLMLVYPHVLQGFLDHYAAPAPWARYSMLLDVVFVGLMVALVGFNFEATAVLGSLLLISVLIVGGFKLLLLVIPPFLISVWIARYVFPTGLSGGDSFYLTCLFAIVGYVIFVGGLVFSETRRLHWQQREVTSLKVNLEKFRLSIMPFLPFSTLATDVGLVPERKRLTVLFADIEGFTDLMDSSDEAWVVMLLNSYFSAVSQLTHHHGGTVDKFIGDGAMVYFGDPSSKGAGVDALACVSMALGLQQKFNDLADHYFNQHLRRNNSSRVNPSLPRLRMRIGIHTGYCLVGQFGCDERKDYTALGGTVNRASRLEGQARGGEILMSAETHRLIQGRVVASYRGQVALKGVAEKMTVYRLDAIASAETDTQLSLLG